MAKRYKRHRDYGFFDQDIRLSKLSELGDPLERLNIGVDFELFRVLLEERFSKSPKGKGGRPPLRLRFNVQDINFATLL